MAWEGIIMGAAISAWHSALREGGNNNGGGLEGLVSEGFFLYDI
jgi:hypothetical protein